MTTITTITTVAGARARKRPGGWRSSWWMTWRRRCSAPARGCSRRAWKCPPGGHEGLFINIAVGGGHLAMEALMLLAANERVCMMKVRQFPIL
eukprot:5712938-Pyramimonas_sp.AAC.1